MSALELIQQRFVIGYERYGCGMLNPKNDRMNFRKETIEELLDAVIYSSANAVRNTTQVSTIFKTKDDGSICLELVVNYELVGDGNLAIFENIVKQSKRRYEYSHDKMSLENEVMLMCLNALEFALNK